MGCHSLWELPLAHPASLPARVLILFPIGSILRGPSAAASRPAGLWALRGGYLSLMEAMLMRGQKGPLRVPNLMTELLGVWMNPLVLCTQCSVRAGVSLAGGFYGFLVVAKEKDCFASGSW